MYSEHPSTKLLTAPEAKRKPQRKRRLPIIFTALVLLAAALYFGSGYILDWALESKGLRKLISGKTAKLLDCEAGYLPLRSHGVSITSAGFLAQASPPRALTEMRAAHLFARCNLIELWHGKWRIDNLVVFHLQAAYGEAAAQHLNRTEFPPPELEPPLLKESPIDLDLRQMQVARTDLFWGTTPEAGGEFRDVRANFYPRDKKLIIHGSGGTFQQAKWPIVQVQQFKLFYDKPELRVDEGSFSLGGQSSISVLGSFRFEEQSSVDLQLTFAQCPVTPFLSEAQRSKFQADFDGTCHLQKDATQTESARANGSLVVAKAILKNVQALQRVADFTGRKELARLPINQIKGDYDWNSPALAVKNFILESKDLVIVKGDFTMKDKRLDGEFQLGVSPDVVDKFPGARDEVFKRSEGGYLWTELTLSGPMENLRDNLKPRLVRAAQNHFAKGFLAPIFKPGQTIIQAIEEL